MAFRQVARDHRVVARRMREHLRGQPGAQRQRGLARVRLQLFQQGGIVRRIHDYRHGVVILCRRAQHGGAADVDMLYRLSVAAVRACDGFREWIKIDHQEVDGRDLMQRHHRIVHTAASEQAAVNFRMQRFDTPIHDFRKACVAGDLAHRQARAHQQPCGAAGREDLDVVACEPARQLDQSRLVGDGQ